MLTQGCGLPFGPYTPNIDIVYLTDGRHNGPCRSNLNNELDCFHRPSRPNINTYAIAIGNAAFESVQALEKTRTLSFKHLFDMENFDELQETVTVILAILNQVDTNGNPLFDCVSHDQKPCRKGWPKATKTAALPL